MRRSISAICKRATAIAPKPPSSQGAARPVNLDAQYRVLAGKTGPFQQATVHCLAADGVTLLIRREIQAGTNLSLMLLKPGRTDPIYKLTRVRFVTDIGPQGWLVECNFATRFRDDELRWLLS